MKTVLWLCNNPTPQATEAFGWSKFYTSSWMVWFSEELGKSNDYKLCLAFQSKNVRTIDKCEVDGVCYYVIPNNTKNCWTYDLSYEENFEKILEIVKPDIVHIWGTEYQHSLALIKVCEKKKIVDRCVVSIQGLVSVCANHYLGNLNEKEKKTITLRDFVKRDTLKTQQEHFVKRGKFEIECLQMTKHVIGRTDWDKALTLKINPKVMYHFNNENLRDGFYENKWSIDTCIRHRIFVSQAHYPVKGFDVLLKALPGIIQDYPDSRVVVAGHKVLTNNKYKKTGYDEILRKLIKENHLESYIEFIGVCDEKKMVSEFLKANVFVCPSAIENSPNSVGEAMLMGTPVVASNVGGTNCLLTHNKEGFLYQADADYMLAFYVKEVFANLEKTIGFSKAARIHAIETHNREKNYMELLDIYDQITEVVKKKRR